MPFERKRVPLAAIDEEDHTYRLGDSRDVTGLVASIAHLGLLCAPILIGTNERWTVVGGFRRVAACRRLRMEKMPARIPLEAAEPWQCARWAVAEKAAERPLEALEAGRALRLLRRFAPDANAFGRTVRLFGLPDQATAQVRLEGLCDLPDGIQAAVSDGALAVSTALSLGRMTPETARRVAALLSALRFGVNKQREVLTLLEEIARREGMPLDAVLEAPELKALATDVDSDPAQRGHRLRTYLYQRRYPALSRAQRRFDVISRGLCPAPGAQLSAPQGFESRAFRLTLAFSSRSDLGRHRQTLEQLLSHPDLDEMFQLA
jgi:ParB family transcriptional regulator, chromosome partitioning protein